MPARYAVRGSVGKPWPASVCVRAEVGARTERRQERTLPDRNAGIRHLQVVVPSNRLMDPETRAFVDMAVESFADAATR